MKYVRWLLNLVLFCALFILFIFPASRFTFSDMGSSLLYKISATLFTSDYGEPGDLQIDAAMALSLLASILCVAILSRFIKQTKKNHTHVK
jgi:hypothetical protein